MTTKWCVCEVGRRLVFDNRRPGFLAIRVTTDVGNLRSGMAPPLDDFARRYFDNPAVAYLHIVPGVLYLLGATLQLSRRIRNRSIGLHRRLGRVLGLGLPSGVMAVVVGVVMPFDGVFEGSASVIFGIYFVTALVLAFRQSGDLMSTPIAGG